MKKFFAVASIVIASIVLNGCVLGGAGGSTTSNAGANAASGLLTSVLTSNGTQVVGTLLNTLLTGSSASKASIQGTWTYSAPKVVFESQNILAQLGSTVASNKIESTLGSQLKKMGFSAGKSTLTLNSDNTCVLTLSNKTANGTYTYDPKTSTLTLSGALGLANTSCTCTVNGNELYMLYDADKLLTVATAMSTKTSSASTLSSLLGSYNGMKLGWTMTK